MNLVKFLSLLLVIASYFSHAQNLGSPLTASDKDELTKISNISLTLAAYTVTPDVTTSSLTLESSGSTESDAQLFSLGGGFTLENSLYLEGTIGYSRYEHPYSGTTFKQSDLRWNSYAATGGIGWDFTYDEDSNWIIRPIINFTFGRTVADSYFLPSSESGHLSIEKDILGYGGSLMLDYENIINETTIDLEARYTLIKLHAYDVSTELSEGDAYTNAINIWGRTRTSTPWTVFQQPLRFVLEASISGYMGKHKEAFDVSALSSIGSGLEVDLAKHNLIVHKFRLIARYLYGDNIKGYSVSLAVSF